jgi:Tuberculosis necrotizing toxin
VEGNEEAQGHNGNGASARVVAIVLAAIVLGSVFALVTGSVAVQQSQAARRADATRCSTAYLDYNKALGAETLPRSGAIATMLLGYRRFGGYRSSGVFLAMFQPLGKWQYSDDNGFREVNEKVDEKETELLPGEEVDRFGAESGKFLAPLGTPYTERALPPANLDGTNGAVDCDYHKYEVVKEFDVMAGRAEPWFGQTGMGTQYLLLRGSTVCSLVENGDLKRLSPQGPKDHCSPRALMTSDGLQTWSRSPITRRVPLASWPQDRN